MVSEYNHKQLGNIRLVRNARVRRITVSVNRNGEVRLSYPWFTLKSTALGFLDQKCEWIAQARLRQQKRNAARTLEEGFKTRTHTLRFLQGARVSVCIDENYINIGMPQGSEVCCEQIQTAARRGVTEAYRQEAKQWLIPLVARLADAYGFRYNKVTIKNIHSKWGSCSQSDNINLSLYLMALPDELIEFVVLHELCHTRVKNHSVQFHALLNSLVAGRESELNRQLRGYSTKI